MDFEVIKSKYTEKDVKKMLTLKRLYDMIPMRPMGMFMHLLSTIFGILSVLLFIPSVVSLWYIHEVYSNYGDGFRLLIFFINILYLCMSIFMGAFSYQELIGQRRKLILGCYRDADRLCKDLLAEQMKSGLFHADVYIDAQRNEIVAIIKGDCLGTKQVYHFGSYLQQVIDEEQKIIDLSELDQIFGLDDVCKNQ